MKIEKNIPLPEARGKWADLAKQMEDGDSILFKDANEAFGLRLAMRNKKMKVVTKKQDCGGMRVWRKA